MTSVRTLLGALIFILDFQLGVTSGEADRNVGKKWFDEPLPIEGIDAGADGA